MSTKKPQKKDANSAVYLSRGLQEIILAEAVSPSPTSFLPPEAHHNTTSSPSNLKESLAIIEQRQCTSLEFYLKAMWQRLSV